MIAHALWVLALTVARAEDAPTPEAAVPELASTELVFRKRKTPAYPPSERGRGDEVACEVVLVVDVKGAVTDATVSDCPDAFRESVEEAVKTWRFAPHRVDGAPSGFTTELKVRFRERSAG